MHLRSQLSQYDLILGSQSPRRKMLLEQAGLSFRTWAIPTSENYPENMVPEEIALYLCRQKAEAFNGKLSSNSILITADTIVAKDGVILNKADSYEEAFRMISLLNGTVHQVITGVCIASHHKQVSFCETTHVSFTTLTDEEIDWYITQYKPFDKAGAYGIQEWIGMVGVEKIEGCYYNVVGLPVASLIKHLKLFIDKQY